MPIEPMSRTIRKQMLVAEVLILAQELSQQGSPVGLPSREEFESMSIDGVAEMKRELHDFARSLGGLG